jgi:hypothetical protein
MNPKLKFFTLAVVLLFVAWVVYRMRTVPQPHTAAAATPAAKPAPKPVERFVPGVHY